MYKILGGDGKEYGPVSADTLRQWIAEGRANAQTQVQLEGTTNWVLLGSLPEFSAAAPTPMPAAPGLGTQAPVGNAAEMVSGPAIGLIVTAILGGLMNIAGILMNVLGVGLAGAGMSGNEDLPPGFEMLSGGLGIVSGILGLAMSVVVLLGALKMKKLESYTFALVTAIIAMVPCISPCCVIGIPIGIWALVVLNKPEVKGAFH
ncbi:MAG: DUF4339 domain-containing protein [Limisphaerales bacterium]